MGLKPGDEWAVPLCHRHHMEGHTSGWNTFELRHGTDLRAAALKLAADSPFLLDATSKGVGQNRRIKGVRHGRKSGAAIPF